MGPAKVGFGMARSSMLLASLIASSIHHVSSFLVFQNCTPTYPCGRGCLETNDPSDGFIDLDQSACNRSESEGDATAAKRCQCDATTCYRFQKFCLSTCEDHSTALVKACSLCLGDLAPENRLHQEPDIELSDGNNQCAMECKGICLDPKCEVSAPENCSSCAPGYKGKSCQKRCAPGCTGECHGETGFCMACPAGNFGPECEFTCPQNCLDKTCSAARGTCMSCTTGFVGENCSEACPQGFYGKGCGFRCEDTCKGDHCSQVNGACVEGCKPGYFGIRCERACPANIYGQDCLSNCPAACAEGVPCHHETGRCMVGCLPGFRGPHCDKTCPVNKYGANCQFNCSVSCFHQLCNAFSGTCLTCEEQFYGSLCQFRIGVEGVGRSSLEAEVSNGEAVLMICGIILMGILMWIGVAFLLLQQRKRILKDAAKGIDPWKSQWGVWPNIRGFKRAVKVYEKKWVHAGGGDAKYHDGKRSHGKDKKSKREKGARRRSGRMLASAYRKLPWWGSPQGEKPTLPDVQDLERVSKWLARYHGIEQPENDTKSDRKPEKKATESGTESGSDSGTATPSQHSRPQSFKQETSQVTVTKESTDITKDQQEKTTWSSQKSTSQITALHASEELKTQTSRVHTSYANIEDSNAGQFPSNDDEYMRKMLIRRDSIFLSPEPRPAGPNIRQEPKYLKETSKVQWLPNGPYYSSGEDTRPYSTSVREQNTSTTTSGMTYSRTETTPSSSASTESGSTTASNTNTSWRTNPDDSDYTSSDDTSGSYSSEDSEGSSLSTVATTHKGAQNTVGEISTSVEIEEATDVSRLAVVKANAGDSDAAVSDVPTGPGFIQKVIGFFGKMKPPKPYPRRPSAWQTTTSTAQSVPGAGGLHRPFSHKFLINRLETWSRNRGVEHNMDDGVMEIAGTSRGKGVLQQRYERGAGGQSGRTTATHSRAADESSWMSTDLSEKTPYNEYSSSKQQSRSTDADPRTTTTAVTGLTGERYSKSMMATTTSGEDLTDGLSTTISDTVKDGGAKPS